MPVATRHNRDVHRQDTSLQHLHRVAGWLLPGAPTPPPLTPAEADALVGQAIGHGLLGPLIACADAGAIDLTEPSLQRAVDAHEKSMRWCLLLERRLLDIDDWFAHAGGIDYLVIKGPAVAHLDEVDPSLRSFGDLDLLVSGHSMDRALDVLARHGAIRARPARRPGFDARFGKSVGTRFGDRVEVDVHRSLCWGAHGFRIPLERLVAEPDHLVISGRAFTAPKRVHRALHACYHAIVGSPRPHLRTIRDLGWYLSSPDLRPDVLGPEAHLWRGEAVLAEAVQVTLTTLGLDLPEWEAWLESAVIDVAERQLLEQDRRPTSKPFRWTAVRELSWPDRAAFIWAVAVPSRELLDSRGQTSVGRAVSGVRRLLT